MATTENEAKVAQTIADLAAGMDAQEFFQGAAEGFGMVIAQVADDPKQVAEFGRVLAVNATGHACAYMINSRDQQ